MTFPLNPWTAVEDAILRHEWPDVDKVVARTGRPRAGVRHRAARLGLPPRPAYVPEDQWPAADDDRLRELYHTMSASKLGALMGKTKNAVIGRANRLGLSKTTQSAITRRARFVERAQQPKPLPDVGLLLRDLERNQCRYPLAGEGLNTHFCGNPVHNQSSWCQFHHAMVWRKADESSGRFVKPSRSRLHSVRIA